MKFIGIDPGVSTGIGVIDENKKLLHSIETKNPLDIAKVFDRAAEKWGVEGFAIAIEDIVGAGPRSKGLIYTLKLVGFAHWYAEHMGYINTVQPPQRRRPYLTEARAILTAKGISCNPKHRMDALGHALGYREVWLV